MKLVTFRKVGNPRLGCLEEDKVFDLNLAYEAMLERQGNARAFAEASFRVPASIPEFLEGGLESKQVAREAMEWVKAQGPDLQVRGMDVVHFERDVKLLPPILSPSKVICVGINYFDLLEEIGKNAPEEPRLFAKFGNAITSYQAAIVKPRMTQALGYEAELAFVIGKRCKRVPEAKAYEYIGGYMAFNDVSASDLTQRDIQNLRGKSFDTFAPTGPFLLTPDELPDPHHLRIQLRVNGRTLQDSNTCFMVHKVPELLRFCSEVFTLEAGDIIATGTPGGLAKDRTPPTYMNPGDVMETEIESLGLMRNPIVFE